MKLLLFIPLLFISLTNWSQDKLLIDQHALAETLRKGETGLEKTEMSEYASGKQIEEFVKNNKIRF